jgi:hypothetical protein
MRKLIGLKGWGVGEAGVESNGVCVEVGSRAWSASKESEVEKNEEIRPVISRSKSFRMGMNASVRRSRGSETANARNGLNHEPSKSRS